MAQLSPVRQRHVRAETEITDEDHLIMDELKSFDDTK